MQARSRPRVGGAFFVCAALLRIAAGGPGVANADATLPEGIDGVLSLTPVQATSYIAVELATSPTMSVAGLKWVHNDATSTFPRVLVVGAGEDGLPDLGDIRAEQGSVGGGNLAWNELALPEALASSAGELFAVFQLPAYEERTAEGLGGGSGLGFRNAADGKAAYLSTDGVEWVRVSPRITLAVEAVMTAASGATSTASKAAMPNIEEPASAAAVTALYAVEPGPLAGSSVVRFSLARAGQVVIEVYNVRGQRVRALTKDILAAGEHVLDWQGDDERGSPVASGTYIVRMEALAGC